MGWANAMPSQVEAEAIKVWMEQDEASPSNMRSEVSSSSPKAVPMGNMNA